MQSLGLAAFIVIPGVRYIFLNFIGGIHVHIVDSRQVTIQDDAGRYQETGRVVHALFREIAIGQEIAQAFATRTPVLVKTGDGQQIGNVYLIHEDLHLGNDVLHLCQPLGIDG